MTTMITGISEGLLRILIYENKIRAVSLVAIARWRFTKGFPAIFPFFSF